MFPDTCLAIQSLLQKALAPDTLEVVDNSHHHQGHAGARENPNKGHFHVVISAPVLQGMNKVQQHRKIYASLATIMDKIHALEISIR